MVRRYTESHRAAHVVLRQPNQLAPTPQIAESFSIICTMTSPLSALENWEAVYPDVDVALTRPISRNRSCL